MKVGIIEWLFIDAYDVYELDSVIALLYCSRLAEALGTSLLLLSPSKLLLLLLFWLVQQRHFHKASNCKLANQSASTSPRGCWNSILKCLSINLPLLHSEEECHLPRSFACFLPPYPDGFVKLT